MSKTHDVLLDITPGPIYRFFDWIKNRPRQIKWWFQRANGKLPVCDCWDYRDTLERSLKQGIEYLLREGGHIDWASDREHRKMKKDLEFILEWLEDYEFFYVEHRAVPEQLVAGRDIDLPTMIVVPQDWVDEFEKRREKAFRLLGKWFWLLWD